MQDAAECIPGVIQYIQNKLLGLITELDADKRPWWQRYLLAPQPCRSSKNGKFVDIATLKVFSDFDEERLTCRGKSLGRWWVHVDRIAPMDGSTVIPDEISSKAIAIYVDEILLVSLGISESADRCLIEEVDYKGCIKKTVYRLPSGCKSLTLGDPVGRQVVDRVDYYEYRDRLEKML